MYLDPTNPQLELVCRDHYVALIVAYLLESDFIQFSCKMI